MGSGNPQLAGTRRVIRVDLAGHGRSASPAGGYDVPAQARRAGARVELLPGVGHTPMLEDPQTTGTLLLRFAVAAEHCA